MGACASTGPQEVGEGDGLLFEEVLVARVGAKVALEERHNLHAHPRTSAGPLKRTNSSDTRPTVRRVAQRMRKRNHDGSGARVSVRQTIIRRTQRWRHRATERHAAHLVCEPEPVLVVGEAVVEAALRLVDPQPRHRLRALDGQRADRQDALRRTIDCAVESDRCAIFSQVDANANGPLAKPKHR